MTTHLLSNGAPADLEGEYAALVSISDDLAIAYLPTDEDLDRLDALCLRVGLPRLDRSKKCVLKITEGCRAKNCFKGCEPMGDFVKYCKCRGDQEP